LELKKVDFFKIAYLYKHEEADLLS